MVHRQKDLSQHPLILNSIGPFEGSPQEFWFKVISDTLLYKKKGSLAEMTTQYHLLYPCYSL